MISFSKAKDMFRIQREAKKVKKELSKIHVEAEGKYCSVVVSGEQEVVSITFTSQVSAAEQASDLMDALNRALKKAQVVSSEKMQGIMGEMGLSPES